MLFNGAGKEAKECNRDLTYEIHQITEEIERY